MQIAARAQSAVVAGAVRPVRLDGVDTRDRFVCHGRRARRPLASRHQDRELHVPMRSAGGMGLGADGVSPRSIPTVPGRRLSDNVAAALLAKVTSGEYAAGDRLPPEREMAIRFGVSRTVIREAMKALASRGVVTVRARIRACSSPGTGIRGGRVAPLAGARFQRGQLRAGPRSSRDARGADCGTGGRSGH